MSSQLSNSTLDTLSNTLKLIYSKVYQIERVCYFRGNVGLYDGRSFVLFLSKQYILKVFNINLENTTRSVEDLNLFELIQEEKKTRIKLNGVF